MGYEQLKNILDENRTELERTKREEDDPASVCPACGWMLSIRADGQKACSICEWIGR